MLWTDEIAYSKIKAALNLMFNPMPNIDYERYNFSQERQKAGETTDEFAERMDTLIKY